MKSEVAKAIVDAGEGSYAGVELREDYSGRGMYGKTTCAVIYEDEGAFLQCVAAAAIQVSEADQDGCSVDEFIEALGNLHRDNMGRSATVIY